ncbi:hypothetical protein AY472_08840 [Corynebacterium diphtheriae bv. gravis]|nr:hypothetical protein AY472_08840 [Corynebacterium diphtheriae bv. gravis]
MSALSTNNHAQGATTTIMLTPIPGMSYLKSFRKESTIPSEPPRRLPTKIKRDAFTLSATALNAAFGRRHASTLADALYSEQIRRLVSARRRGKAPVASTPLIVESLHFHQRNQLIDAVGASTFQGRHIGFLAQFEPRDPTSTHPQVIRMRSLRLIEPPPNKPPP